MTKIADLTFDTGMDRALLFSGAPRRVVAQMTTEDDTETIGEVECLIPAGTWVVRDANGNYSLMTDADFRKEFEPTTRESADYCMNPPAGEVYVPAPRPGPELPPYSPFDPVEEE